MSSSTAAAAATAPARPAGGKGTASLLVSNTVILQPLPPTHRTANQSAGWPLHPPQSPSPTEHLANCSPATQRACPAHSPPRKCSARQQTLKQTTNPEKRAKKRRQRTPGLSHRPAIDDGGRIAAASYSLLFTPTLPLSRPRNLAVPLPPFH